MRWEKLHLILWVKVLLLGIDGGVFDDENKGSRDTHALRSLPPRATYNPTERRPITVFAYPAQWVQEGIAKGVIMGMEKGRMEGLEEVVKKTFYKRAVSCYYLKS